MIAGCRRIALNEDGSRIGEGHQRATIPDAVVNECRELHEAKRWGYRRIAAALGLRRDTVRRLCKYERRQQVAQKWKSAGYSDEQRGCEQE